MKKKIIILTLCFTIIISSINFRKVDALVDGGVISLPILATLSTVAVGSCIYLTNKDDIVDLGRMFYDNYVDSWDSVNEIFNKGAVLSPGGILNISKECLALCTDFFDNVFSTNTGNISFVNSLPIYPTFTNLNKNSTVTFGDTGIKAVVDSSGRVKCYYGSYLISDFTPVSLKVSFTVTSTQIKTRWYNSVGLTYTSQTISHSIPFSFVISTFIRYRINITKRNRMRNSLTSIS